MMKYNNKPKKIVVCDFQYTVVYYSLYVVKIHL